jgi:hypothetical protein
LQYHRDLDEPVFGGGQKFISPSNCLMTWSLYYINRLMHDEDYYTNRCPYVLCLLALRWWTT